MLPPRTHGGRCVMQMGGRYVFSPQHCGLRRPGRPQCCRTDGRRHEGGAVGRLVERPHAWFVQRQTHALRPPSEQAPLRAAATAAGAAVVGAPSLALCRCRLCASSALARLPAHACTSPLACHAQGQGGAPAGVAGARQQCRERRGPRTAAARAAVCRSHARAPAARRPLRRAYSGCGCAAGARLRAGAAAARARWRHPRAWRRALRPRPPPGPGCAP